jgi:cell division protein FtsQ
MAKRRRKGGRSGRRFAFRRAARLVVLAAAAGGAIGAGAWIGFAGGKDLISARIATAGDAIVRRAGLTVEDVTVTGRHYTRAHEILAALDVSRGDPITAIDPETARQRVVALDWVRSASIMRLYPDTIHIAIEEHEPMAIWRRGDVTSLIDERGAVVSDLDVRSFPHLPMVEGPGAADAAPEFLAELGRRPAISGRVSASVRVGERRWSLRLDNGVIVHLPEDGVGRALDELVGLDQAQGLIDRDVAVVDMRLPDRVTVMPGRHGASRPERDAAGGAGART